MPRNYSAQLPARVTVILDGTASHDDADFRRALRDRAVAEARAVLAAIGDSHDIWSHAFQCNGADFLLSTRVRPVHEITILAGHRKFLKRLPARLIIEVSRAPTGLTPRTLLRPRQQSAAGRRSSWVKRGVGA